MKGGIGRTPPADHDLSAMLHHRRNAVAAALARARRDDALERELAELDEAIARGVDALSEDERQGMIRRWGPDGTPVEGA